MHAQLPALSKLQVQRQSYADTVRVLWYEERYNIFIKGLSARLVSSAIFSLLTITGYETVKRCSLSEDYVDKIRW
jgi:solute carrier family 25 protein 44